MSYLEDGYQTLISFAENPAVHLKEKTITPPGIDGGDAIDVTTMRNEDWRTFALRALKTLTESSFRAAYDPVIYDELDAMINVNQLITITFSDGSSVAFWGGLRTAQPQEVEEGAMPEVECNITPTNRDNTGAEVAPVYTAAA